jgi:uncharacterized protein YndB with AHSA1/START domain
MNTSQDFYTEIYIQAPKERVWDAFVLPGQFFHAFYGADIQSSFEIGSRLAYVAEAQGAQGVHIYGEVLEYVHGSLLAYTDHPGPIHAANHAELQARVRISFEAMGTATKLSLLNDQFSPDNPMQQEAQQWYLILSNFKTYLETGKLMQLDAAIA